MYSEVKTKDAYKKYFCMSCLQNLTTKEILNNHKERCLLNNETQAVKYETGIIKFKSYEKQIPIPFKFMLIQNAFSKESILMKVNTQNYIKNTFLIL